MGDQNVENDAASIFGKGQVALNDKAKKIHTEKAQRVKGRPTRSEREQALIDTIEEILNSSSSPADKLNEIRKLNELRNREVKLAELTSWKTVDREFRVKELMDHVNIPRAQALEMIEKADEEKKESKKNKFDKARTKRRGGSNRGRGRGGRGRGRGRGNTSTNSQ